MSQTDCDILSRSNSFPLQVTGKLIRLLVQLSICQFCLLVCHGQRIGCPLRLRLEQFRREEKLLEAQRLEQRTMFDLEMIEATGSCAGIENYSRWLTGRRPAKRRIGSAIAA